MIVLALNCGSATVKYKLFESSGAELRVLKQGIQELQGGYASAISALIAGLPKKPELIAHRVVHGGEIFTGPTRIDVAMRKALAALSELAPLHNPPALEGIAACDALGVPMAAIFDTTFHRTIPAAARTYALPKELAQRRHFQRFGFHGISHQYVTERYAELHSKPEPTLITLHLGNGASATAVLRGKSVETSMGFSPLEGLVMGTRGGDIDPAILLDCLRNGMAVEQLDAMLNHESGLQGLAGVSDMRKLLARKDADAQLAVAVFCHRVRKYVGAYLAILEGQAEALVFTGGIGEHAPEIRTLICAGFHWAGLDIDTKRNVAADGKVAAEISTAGSHLKAYVIPTDEELAMARQAVELISGG